MRSGSGRPEPLDLAYDPRVRRLTRGRVSARLYAVAWLIAAVALLGPALVVRFGPPRTASFQLLLPIPGRVVPLAELPPVEPVEIRSLTPDAARAFNATVPFSTAANPAARAFRPAGSPADLARATDCLAAAVYYEAGEDPDGQRAVAQVVLNRVRHPAFPKTVCGVVFQGSERPTGCQFTFTCDGSLLRYAPTPDGWTRARRIAAAALGGGVDHAVGYATHYHTEWVVPYWQASLDKIVAVHTQLFYRWSGWWGTPPAFNRRAEAVEPVVPALGRLSDAHRVDAADVPAATWADDPLDDPAVPVDQGASPERLGQFLVTLPAGLPPARWGVFAGQLCGARAQCRVMAWRDKAHAATTLPLEPTQIASMAFSYVRDRPAGLDRSLWNCQEAKRPDPRQCMKRQMLLTAAPFLDDAVPVAPGALAGPPDAFPDPPGVRRKALSPAGDARPDRVGDRPRNSTPPGTSPAAAP